MKIPRYILGVLLWLDEGVNVLVFPVFSRLIKIKIPALGNSHYTMSDVFAEGRERGQWWGKAGCKFCNWLFRVKDHCKEAMIGMPEDEGMDG